MMRVLVTGAGGFVCRSIIAELLTHDYDIVAFDRYFDAELTQRWAGTVQMIQSDVMVDAISNIEFDAFVHGAALTASVEESGMSPVENLRANIDPMLNMIEAAGRDKRGILISSDAAFRHTSGAIPDDAIPVPLGLYAVAKRTTESLVETLRELHGYDLTTVRLGSIYGPEEKVRDTRPRVSYVGKLIHEGLTQKTLTVTGADETHDWTYAPDIGRAVHALLQAETWHHALYNVACGQAMTNLEVAKQIQQVIPDAEIVISDEELHPRQGYMVSERLRQDAGFSQWTPFAEGVSQIVQTMEPQQ